ncbi:SDR family NAD(P)-dependent oxidoreductase [Dongia sp.]|uniref:SDR family NAD(P)-dependent oxidoreductase n=1 Tax=Dongia sp. TaxID=1977262 RepID=UPI0035B0A42C
MNRDFRSILITGASSGLGEALAYAYAAPDVQLHLGARRAELLDSVAAACRAKGAAVATEAIDVTAAEAMADWIGRSHRRCPLDLVIANAGISGGTHAGVESDAQVRAIFAVNVDGVLNTVLPALPLLMVQGAGQIGIMASLAGQRGFPGAPAYCGSKAAVKVWGEGLRGAVADRGIGVSVIMPGFVVTPMTAVNDFPMPFLMPADKAARIIQNGLACNRARISFPWPTAFIAWLFGTLPPALTDRLLRATPRKA